MDIYYILVTIIGFSVCKADSNITCGCLMHAEEWESENTYDCSNQTSTPDFKCLSELKPNILKLKDNKYGSPPSELLQYDFSNLTYIDLSYNEITEMPDDWVRHFPSIRKINLDHNRLLNALELIEKYANINIPVHYNPIICDCEQCSTPILKIANNHRQTITCSNGDKPISFFAHCAKCSLPDNTDKFRKDWHMAGLLIIIIIIIIVIIIVIIRYWRLS
ncbi:PREDICTED: uncharacterized protein LOC108620635, partial [Drosophila arizonae]|uniref:Uncharacterized protein LOC108620635 n=1 Tax=Drosophila arizonae TaxID=7263 RepID=A0ABM1Q0P0_DROAR